MRLFSDATEQRGDEHEQFIDELSPSTAILPLFIDEMSLRTAAQELCRPAME